MQNDDLTPLDRLVEAALYVVRSAEEGDFEGVDLLDDALSAFEAAEPDGWMSRKDGPPVPTYARGKP